MGANGRAGVFTTAIERMQKRLVIDEDGCWVWPGSVNGNGVDIGGYGQVGITENRTTDMVHLISYRHFHGPIPPGQVVDHICHTDICADGPLCKHRRCWNPAHLVATDFTSNCARGNAPGQTTKRTGICKRNHDLAVVGVRTGLRASGTEYSRCRACDDERARRRRAGLVGSAF